MVSISTAKVTCLEFRLRGGLASRGNPVVRELMKPIARLLLLCVACTAALAQHDHMHHQGMSHEGMPHKIDPAAKMQVQDTVGTHTLLVRVGPLNLPARASHMEVAQAAPQVLEVPVEGWFTAYHPRLVDGAGKALPGRMLHHVAFWNTGRPDFLCQN